MTRKILTFVAVAACVVLLAIAVAAGWFWATIPSAPDPATLPSVAAAPPAPGYRELIDQAQALSRRRLAEEKLPGLSVAVAVGGDLVWAEGFGWASIEDQTPVDPETMFRIGGLSTTITAAAVGRLVERGDLDLDAPVGAYLPGLPAALQPLTCRRLMSHTAGLRPLRVEAAAMGGAACPDDEARLVWAAAVPPASEQGAVAAYSVTGWVLTGAALAAAGGRDYHDLVQQDVLSTVGMHHTVAANGAADPPGSARFYYPRAALDPRLGLQDAPRCDLSCIVPAGGFLSTPSDLVRLASAMMMGAFLDSGTVAELQAPATLASGAASPYALGWAVQQMPLGPDGAASRVVGAGLGDPVRRRPLSAVTVGEHAPGATATLLTVPEQGLAIAVMANVSGAASVPRLARELADLMLH